MNAYTNISSIELNDINKQVNVLGYVQTLRSQKKMSFIELKNGQSQIQVIIPTKLIDGLTVQSYVCISGTVQLLPKDKFSVMPFEIFCSDIKILSRADPSYSAQCPVGAGSETKLELRHLYLRDPTFVQITVARSQFISAIRKYFESNNTLEIIPPAFTGVECEGGASLFKVLHPGKTSDKPITAFLSQSSQFALEMEVPAVGDCFCIAPSFRAENSHTRRHLTEFLHAECEWSGVLTFDMHLEKLKSMLQGIVQNFYDIAKLTLKKLGKEEHVLKMIELTKDIVILEHKEAINLCNEKGIYADAENKTLFSERDDIPEAQERALIDSIGKIVFLVKFPKEFKSFYMAKDPNDLTRVLGCDVEVPNVGEIIGSSVRVSEYDELIERLKEANLNEDDYREYTDLRKYGFGQTSGMGLGVDRMLTWLLELHSIRDVTTFPRFPGYLRP